MGNTEKIYEQTGIVIGKALEKALELNIRDFVMASCTGRTAEIFLEKVSHMQEKKYFKNISGSDYGLIPPELNVVCVTHQIGFSNPNQDEMSGQMREKLKKRGIKLLTTTHLFGGVDRALRLHFKGVYPNEIVSSTLRLFGQGPKVCVEIAVMAADAGLVRAGYDLVALGGTGKGADSAVIICPAHSQNFFDTKIREVIIKPFE